MLIGFADEGIPADWPPVKGGVFRSFLEAAGDVITFFGRFLLRDLCFEPVSGAAELDVICEADWLSLRGVRGGVVGCWKGKFGLMSFCEF